MQVEMESGNTVAMLKIKIEKNTEISEKEKIPANLQIIELYNKNNETRRMLEDEEILDEIKDEKMYKLIVTESKLL